MTMREFSDTPSIETPASPVTLAWLDEELSRRGLQTKVQMSVRHVSAIPFVVAACDCVSIIPREVFDVSGAGDTVIAAMTLCHAAGRSLPQAMHIANAAASVVVSKLGTATASMAEVLRELALQDQAFDATLASGTQSLKGPTRPVDPLDARAQAIAALRHVDCIVSFDGATPIELIRELLPNVLVKGADYDPDRVVGAELVRAAGGRVLLAPLMPGHSTTGLVTRMQLAPTG